MKILFILIGLTLLFSALGWGLVRTFIRQPIALPVGTLPVLGYSAAIAAFFPLFFLLESAYVTTWAILGVGAVLALWALWKARHGLFGRIKAKRILILPYLFFFSVMLVAAIPYINAGIGQYWHTGNEDVLDGLHGRNAYIRGELIGKANFDISSRAGSTLSESLRNVLREKKEKNATFFRERYVHDLGRLQYASLGFFSALLDMPKGMDVFIFQALLNLGFFALGVYAFSRNIFLQNRALSIGVATISSLGNFYFTTYVNGHEGSLIYNAAVPFIMYFGVVAIRDRLSLGAWIVIPIVMLAMVALAYPYPLMYAVAPLVVYGFLSWWGVWQGGRSVVDIFLERRFQMLIITLMVIGFVAAYMLGEPIRFRAVSQFRSWGTAINHIGFLQFWGLWPSGVAFSQTNLVWLDTHLPIKIASLGGASILSLLAIYGFSRLLKQGVSFLLVWITCWVFFFVVMRFAVYDSYYVYKFLYINAWVIVAGTVAGLASLLGSKRMILRLAAGLVGMVWVGANITHNISAMHGIANNDFNVYPESFQRVLEAPAGLLGNSYVDIPLDAHANLVRLIIGEGGHSLKRSKAEAQYLLHEKGITDIFPQEQGKVVWESDRFVLAEKPASDLVEIATYWQPEDGGGGEFFRWVSDARIGKVLIDIKNRNPARKYLYLCGESGPSIDYRKFELQVMDVSRKVVGSMPMAAYGCHSLDISGFDSPFSIEHQEKGRIVSYIDNRKLVYRIMKIGFATNEVVFTPDARPSPEDIVSKAQLQLGKNWYPYEVFNGDKFRWVNNAAEVLLLDTGRAGILAIEAEPGPSAGGPIKLRVENQLGEPLGECFFEGRTVCELRLMLKQGEPGLLKLVSDAKGQPIKTDPRILNFRVFQLGWKH